jgi:hypothetical protein
MMPLSLPSLQVGITSFKFNFPTDVTEEVSVR